MYKRFLFILMIILTSLLTSCNLAVDRSQILNKEDYDIVIYNGNEYIFYNESLEKEVYFNEYAEKTFIGYVYGNYDSIKEAFLMKGMLGENVICDRGYEWVKKDFEWPTMESVAYKINVVIYYKTYSIDIESTSIKDLVNKVDIVNNEKNEILYQTWLSFAIDEVICYKQMYIVKNDDILYLADEIDGFNNKYNYYKISDNYYQDLEKIINEHYKGKDYAI